MRILLVMAVVALSTSLGSARAATTVFGASVYSQTGPVTSAANALGAADGSSATLGRNSFLTLQLSAAISGTTTTVTGVAGGPGTNVQISIGELVGGVPIFTPTINFSGGGTATLDFSADCALISATGCSLLRIRTFGAPSASFSLDGVSGISSAPEPGAWALMIIGFAGLAAQLKHRRRMHPIDFVAA